jgi:hypothetical protein
VFKKKQFPQRNRRNESERDEEKLKAELNHSGTEHTEKDKILCF